MSQKEQYIKAESQLTNAASAVRHKVKQIAKCKVDLEVTPSMRIGVGVYIKTKIVNLPPVKKQDAINSGNVRIDRTYVRLDDPNIAIADKMTALRYGAEYVPLPSADLAAMRLQNQSKCLKVIGFFDKNLFGVHRLISGADCIAAEPGNIHAAIALSALIHAMLEDGKVALCRFSVRDNSEPKLMCLHPHVEDAFECFYSVQVPFAEDSRENSLLFPSLPKAEDSLLSAIDDLIDSRMLVDKTGEMLRPELTMNPTIDRFWKTVEIRANSGNERSPILPVDPILDEYIHPERFLFDNGRLVKIFNRIGDMVKLEEAQEDTEEVKRKKKFWRDFHDRELVTSPVANIDVKRIRVEDEIPEGTTQATTGDIQAYLEYLRSTERPSTGSQEAKVVIPRIISQMEDVISGLIKAGSLSQAADSIEALRSSCVEERVPELFNKYLADQIKEATVHPRLWRDLIGRGVTLINKDEAPASAASHSDALEFLQHVMKMV